MVVLRHVATSSGRDLPRAHRYTCRSIDAGDEFLNRYARLPYVAAAHVANLAATVVDLTVPSGRQPKLLRGLARRRGALGQLKAWARTRSERQPLLWMHAASVGEGLMAVPVIQAVRRVRPDILVLYTHFSPSAERFAASVPADHTGYLPFDTPSNAAALLDAARPAVVAFSKLDVWPLLTEAAHRRGVRLALTSASVEPGSGRQSALARALLRDAYRALDSVGAASAADADRLVDLGVRAEAVAVTGDVRYDQVWARVHGPARHADVRTRLSTDRPTIVAGSTWPADDTVVLGAFRQLRAGVPGARLVLAAHEPGPAHTASALLWAAGAGFSAAPIADANAETDVVIVNTVGMLADLYSLASVAFVGGGFRRRGLHSVVEPAAWGVPVYFGPGASRARDATALVDAGGGAIVRNAEGLAATLRAVLNDDARRAASGAAARDVIRSGLGAADRSANLLLTLLGPR